MEREASCTDEEQASGIGSRGVEIRGKQFRKEQIWLDRQPQNRGRTRAEQGQNKGRSGADQGQIRANPGGSGEAGHDEDITDRKIGWIPPNENIINDL